MTEKEKMHGQIRKGLEAICACTSIQRILLGA